VHQLICHWSKPSTRLRVYLFYPNFLSHVLLGLSFTACGRDSSPPVAQQHRPPAAARRLWLLAGCLWLAAASVMQQQGQGAKVWR
jgi:hypothetical protein